VPPKRSTYIFVPLSVALLKGGAVDEGTLKAAKLSRDIRETAMRYGELIARILLDALPTYFPSKSREYIGITRAKRQCT
jgi:hypothetical protein